LCLQHEAGHLLSTITMVKEVWALSPSLFGFHGMMLMHTPYLYQVLRNFISLSLRPVNILQTPRWRPSELKFILTNFLNPVLSIISTYIHTG
jgi:hypothetical protein